MADRILAEYEDEHAIARAIHQLRERGYIRLDAYLPFPSIEVEEALAQPRSRLSLAIFGAGMVAAGTAYALQWLLVAHLYPLVVGGRPPHFPLAFVIITFEMGVLFASLTAFFGVLRLGRLVRLTDAVQGTPGFDSATRDRFWLEVSARDPKFDADRTRAELGETGAVRVESPEGTP
ncbi:MAG TPA: DUF3341 domain-containing protein [Kofleriaceae bacterium]